MKRATTVLCFLASLVVCLGTVSSASAAEPAYYECAKSAGGLYENSTCSKLAGKEAGEKFELREGVGSGKEFSGRAGETKFRIPNGLQTITCSSLGEKGKVSTPITQTNVVIRLKGCRFSYNESKCKSPAAPNGGEIETSSLKGVLGYVKASEHSVGLDLSAEAGSVAEFTCSGINFVITGSVIAAVTEDINVISKNSTSTYQTASGPEGQRIKKFEGGEEDVLLYSLDGNPPERIGLETSVKYTGEPLDIKG
jgi:hypothetical protein